MRSGVLSSCWGTGGLTDLLKSTSRMYSDTQLLLVFNRRRQATATTVWHQCDDVSRCQPCLLSEPDWVEQRPQTTADRIIWSTVIHKNLNQGYGHKIISSWYFSDIDILAFKYTVKLNKNGLELTIAVKVSWRDFGLPLYSTRCLCLRLFYTSYM